MNLKTDRVFYYFEEISKIPRGSGNTKAVSDYCVEFAKKQGLSVTQDQWNNVIIKKQASAQREGEAAVILQGHLDMVAEKVPESSHDFLKDGIVLKREGDYLTADGTTLGADDGIAIAMSLAILEDEELSHPALEVIFTADEETGMDGAMNIDLSEINGKYVLNLDSEDEGVLTAGCAGGARAVVRIPVERRCVSGLSCKLKVSGLKGGHSGVEINKERANALLVMARLLKYLNKTEEFGLMQFAGGGKDNAIPREAESTIVINIVGKNFGDAEKKKIGIGKISEIKEKIADFEEMLKKEFGISDAGLRISFTFESEGEFAVLEEKALERVLFYLNNIPNGVQHMNQDIAGLVETSLNLGIVRLEDSALVAHSSVRSAVSSRKGELLEKIKDMAGVCQGTVSIDGDYPEWEYRRESVLREHLLEIYRKLYGEELRVDVIHAGLECGYLLQKKPDLDLVSFGPQMYDIHTTEERLSIASTEKIYRFVQKILEEPISV